MMLARVVTNVRANFCLKFIQNTTKRREKTAEKKEVLVLLGLYTLNKKISSLSFFLFFFSLVRHKREKRDKQHVREDVETTRDDDDDGVEARNKRSEDVDDHTRAPLAFIRSSFFEGGGKGSKLFCAPCLTSSSSRRGFTVSSVSGENGIGSTIPVAFLEEKKIKNEVEVEESEETNDAFEGLPGYAPPGVDVMLMAVPKAKVTPSRKKRRNQFKRVEFVRDARKCPTCRKPMRSWHNFCCPPKDDEKEDVVYSTTE